jgi:hypothetical protein
MPPLLVRRNQKSAVCRSRNQTILFEKTRGVEYVEVAEVCAAIRIGCSRKSICSVLRPRRVVSSLLSQTLSGELVRQSFAIFHSQHMFVCASLMRLSQYALLTKIPRHPIFSYTNHYVHMFQVKNEEGVSISSESCTSAFNRTRVTICTGLRWRWVQVRVA